jgi:hypothetical protein
VSISSVLGVVIGLVFVYLLLSLMCTAAKEVLEIWLKKRGTDLEAGIRELLNDPAGTGLAKQVFEHPLIFGLFEGDYKPARTWKAYLKNWCRSNLPSYIPARNFAQGLADVVLRPQRVPPVVTSETPTPAMKAVPTAAPLIPASAAPVAVVAGGPAPPPSLHELLNLLPETQARRALLTLADGAGNDEKRLREGIEAWFNSAMDRVSGGYKRWAQVVLLALGLFITVGLNVDTIAICQSLSHDPQQVQKIFNAAEPINKKEQERRKKEVATDPPPGKDKDQTDPTQQWKTELAQLEDLGLPIGWSQSTMPKSDDFLGWLRKVGGLLLTTLAISLGAPFWFDVLNKFMIVRSTVKPHEKSPEEGTKT